MLGNDKSQVRDWKTVKVEVSEAEGFRKLRRGGVGCRVWGSHTQQAIAWRSSMPNPHRRHSEEG